ncbi:hypothetical protein SISNIDRAFT_483583 [Sistotremastrum niveocremeum HHB9708]|uniref:RING-type domain-containing protein n=1 Tax=Sistotremastrum niveocremeum HHB9708 TaxID=1314777 RepID=A0A164XQG8_9AGAM|nr:hypothetical protein SISNIDRAFT_483583 [Sistotremastrum niveocremeum HHB9708]
MADTDTLNINHLLNFSLPPRQSQPTHLRRSRKVGTQQGVWNKEKFVNAQYRFVMKPNGDYVVHFADPDIYFQWDDILQVIIPRKSLLSFAGSSNDNEGQEGLTTCPICLSEPTAPRMTKCGHIFCYPCILHYLSTGQNKWMRCPICFDSVNERQLKAVKWHDGNTLLDSSDIDPVSSAASSSSSPAPSRLHMRLMLRPQITTLALPKSSTWPSDVIAPHRAPFHFLPDVLPFAKFMLGTPDQLTADLSGDLRELSSERRTLESFGDPLGMLFVEKAENKVMEQLEFISGMETSLLKAEIDKVKDEITRLEKLRERRKPLEDETEMSSPPATGDLPDAFLATKQLPFDPPAKQGGARPSKHRRNLNPPPPSTSTYYFYQASNGMPIFLHPLDIRILLAHFSSYSAFPTDIVVHVESFTESTVNEDLRKRCKYLAHLAEGADVLFVEADLQNVVSKETLQSFEGALKSRRAKRKEKDRKEERARIRAEERDREKEREAGAIRDFDSLNLVPVLQDFASGDADDAPVSNSVPPSRPLEGAWGNRSFASAANSGASPSSTQPRLANIAAAREEELAIDIAWHELEQRQQTTRGQKKGRKGRLVILGGGGGRGR